MSVCVCVCGIFYSKVGKKMNLTNNNKKIVLDVSFNCSSYSDVEKTLATNDFKST